MYKVTLLLMQQGSPQTIADFDIHTSTQSSSQTLTIADFDPRATVKQLFTVQLHADDRTHFDTQVGSDELQKLIAGNLVIHETDKFGNYNWKIVTNTLSRELDYEFSHPFVTYDGLLALFFQYRDKVARLACFPFTDELYEFLLTCKDNSYKEYAELIEEFKHKNSG